LWRGEGRGKPVAGLRWMGAGFAALVALAATLGVAVKPVAHLVGEDLPGDLLTVVLGLVAALAGLALGWVVPAGRLLGPARETASAGFRVGGGFYGLVARPALASASALARFDDGVIHAAVLAVGRAGLAVAAASRLGDERGIDALIFSLARGTRSLGSRARELQSGLVHRELLLAATGAALILVVLAIGVVGI
jgi:NADH-quinone oxidoreductase subunit L